MQQPPPQQVHYAQQPGYPQQQGQPYPAQGQQYTQGQAGVPQQAQYVTPPQPQAVQAATVYQPAPTHNKTWDGYNGRASLVMGWMQVTVALVCVLFTSIGMGIQSNRHFNERNGAYYVGGGIWCSIFFFISGGLAIGASTNKTTCMIVSNMVMSIISCVFGFALIGTSAAIIGVEKNQTAYLYQGREHDSIYKAGLAMGVIMLIGALLMVVVTIVMSCYCCAAICCGRRQQPSTMQVIQGTSTMQYVTTSVPGTQTVIVAGQPTVGGQVVQAQAAPAYNPAVGQPQAYNPAVGQPQAYNPAVGQPQAYNPAFMQQQQQQQQPGYPPQMATSPMAPPPYKQ